MRKIYKKSSHSLLEDVKSFISNPENIDNELVALKELMNKEDMPKAEVIFLVDVLSRSIKKQSELVKFIDMIFKHIELRQKYEDSIYRLRILKAIVKTRLYTPISFYIVKTIKDAIEVEHTRDMGNKYTLDNIKITSLELKSNELKDFVVNESISLLKIHLEKFSRSIGFSELAFCVCNELRKCKVGFYRDLIADLIRTIKERSDYIEKKRSELKAKTLTGPIVMAFEAGLDSWIL